MTEKEEFKEKEVQADEDLSLILRVRPEHEKIAKEIQNKLWGETW